MSFDEIVITLFVAGPRVTTLPVEMFRRLDSRSDPMIAVASVMVISATLLVVLAVQRTIGLSKGFVRSHQDHPLSRFSQLKAWGMRLVKRIGGRNPSLCRAKMLAKANPARRSMMFSTTSRASRRRLWS